MKINGKKGVTPDVTKRPNRHIGCDYFFTVNLHPDHLGKKLPLGSGKTVLAGFYILGHTRWFYKHFPKSDYQKMTFAVGRIRKCTLELKLLVILFCSPEVGLSYHVKCADRSAPPPNLRVSENRSIVHFEIERQFPLIWFRRHLPKQFFHEKKK